MLLELTVFFYPDDYYSEPDKYIGKTPKMKKGKMVVISDHISAFNEHDSGGTIIRIDTGEVFHTTMLFEEFNSFMREADMARDVFVSGEN
jgi:hypothetical protein